MTKYVLEVDHLKTYYYTYKGIVKAVDDVSFKLKEGESLGIAGESGCGKSTLAYSLLKLVPPPGRIADGKIIIDGIDITNMSESEVRSKVRWKKISMIFQGAMNALNPVYTVGYQLAEPLIYHKGYTKKEAVEEAKKYLQLVGLSPDIVNRYPHELSGGMKQRVVIAMALILQPKVVIADEPTTALDVVVQAQILNLLKKLQKELGISIILITHDLSIIAELVDKVAVMYAGKIVELGPLEKVFLESQHPYTQALLKSIPRLHGEKSKLEWIPGTPPDLRNPPPGCRFAPRCKYAMDICRRQPPPEVQLSPEHRVLCWLHAKK